MIVVKSAKLAWHKARSVWRLDIQYIPREGGQKRTFINLPATVARDEAKGAVEARKELRAFQRGLSPLYRQFRAKMDDADEAASGPTELSDDAPTTLPDPVASIVKTKVVRPTEPTMAWLFDECLRHPQVWGRVKHPKNYVSAVRKLNAIIGDRPCTDFEAPHGRKVVVEVLLALQSQGKQDGYCRKIMYHLRQALNALIGQGLTHPICHPETGEQMIQDVPTFPPVDRGSPRTATLERSDDKVIFEIIDERRKKAQAEERAHAAKNGATLYSTGGTGEVTVDGETRWLNARRYSSAQWHSFSMFVRFLIETGCRRTEALTLGSHSIREREVLDDNGDVMETFRVIHIPASVTKSGIARDINLTPWVDAQVKWLDSFGETFTMPFRGQPMTIQRSWWKLTPEQATAMWRLVQRDAKARGNDLSDVALHSLRHTFATRMASKGMSGKPLQEALGHADDRTTRIYDHAQQVANSRKFYTRDVGANPASNPS